MRFSLITLVDEARTLNELHASILIQAVADWEWIIVPRGGARIGTIDDPRIRILSLNVSSPFAGALKKIAFAQAGGGVLVDVDADDLLTENCLEQLAAALDDPNVGFVHSNYAVLAENWPGFSGNCGWEYRPFSWRGRSLTEVVSFPATAASLALNRYAPGPIWAWRRTAYDSAGGHDPSEDLLADHQLLIKTYLATRMGHVDQALCLRRVNSRTLSPAADVAQRLQIGSAQLFYNHAYRLVEREADLKGLMKIDLCGGFDKPHGYVSLDRMGGDITCDLDQGIPLPADAVGVVRAHDAIEHLKNPIVTMTEIHRVLSDGGWAMIMVPSTDGRGAFQDPTHVSFWNENSFWYWTRSEQARYIRNTTAKFQPFRLDTTFPSEAHRQTNIPYVTAHLRAVKSGARRPHVQGM